MSDVNTRVARQEAIDKYTEQLVTAAEETLSDSRMEQLKRERDMKLAQLNNFLGVTLATGSVAAISNWVRYQMGRRETSRAWRMGGFGDDVLKAIDQCRGWAKEIALDLTQDDAEAAKVQVQEIHVALVRLYAGYLKRWFVAKGGQQ